MIISVAYGEMEMHVSTCGCFIQGYAMDQCGVQPDRKVAQTASKIPNTIKCFNIKEYK